MQRAVSVDYFTNYLQYTDASAAVYGPAGCPGSARHFLSGETLRLQIPESIADS